LDRSEIETRVKDMVGDTLSDKALAEKYGINSSDWNIGGAREMLRRKQNPQNHIVRCAYRPFDNPYCFFGPEFMDRPRRELLDHVVGRNNIQLVTSRQIGTANWRHAFVAQGPANDCLISDQSREANQVFPLWRFDQGGSRLENISPSFREYVDSRYDHHYTPEEILGYIYAVLNAPSYRKRYAEFLRFDFPRISFPGAKNGFDSLSALGWALVEAHLLRKLQRPGFAQYPVKGSHAVERLRYSPKEQAIWINKTQYFSRVPENIWDFKIGGYRALEKYLKSRKNRILSLDEINHMSAIADSLAFTIDQMTAIDVAYQAAFPERG
jgi:predicted helicase